MLDIEAISFNCTTCIRTRRGVALHLLGNKIFLQKQFGVQVDHNIAFVTDLFSVLNLLVHMWFILNLELYYHGMTHIKGSTM